MKTKIQCPNCSATIKVDELLTVQLEQSIRQSLQSEMQKREDVLNQQKKELETLTEQFAKEKFEIDKTVDSRTKVLLESREKTLREKITKELEDESSLQIQELQDQLQKKSTLMKEFNLTKAQVETLKREKEELETKITLQKEEELTEKLELARRSIKEQVYQETHLKLKEREKVIQDLGIKLDEAKRKAEQGSMQLQGEVQELELVSVLQDLHPTDEIKQSKKGTNAADILQMVKLDGDGQDRGKIYYESKRTKTWSNEWIPKFKQDNLNAKADVLVLVTNALPKGVERYGLVDDVWVCGLADVGELSIVLRYGILKVHAIGVTLQMKDSKMGMLYSYLTSNEFKNVFGTILDGYRSLQDSHNTEKMRIQKFWKEREKTLEHILSNSMNFYGSIRGIAGKAIPEMKMLESPEQKD